MLEFKINGNKVMTIEDDNKIKIFDKKIAEDVAIDIDGRKNEFELCDSNN